MSNVAKFLIILNLILAGAFLGAASNYLGQKDHVQARLESAVKDWQDKHTFSETELKLNKENLLKTGAENSDLKTRLAAAEARAQAAESANQNLVATNNSQGEALNRATAALEAQNNVISANNDTITGLQSERTTLVQSRDAEKDARVKAEAVQAQLQRQLDDEVAGGKAAMAQLGDANAKIQALEAEVEAYRAKYGQEGTVQPAMPPGKVLAVDNAVGLVVLSLGAEDGVKNGFEYIVSRGNQYVGTVKVTDAQAKKSTGMLVPGLQKSPVSAGDTVSNR
jgi:hypothetical protein